MAAMRLFSLLYLVLSGANCIAQPVDLRTGLPQWGAYNTRHHYLADWQGEHLPTTGTQWTWELDSLNWISDGEASDTVWHHSATISPAEGGSFSVYDQHYQRFGFFHLNADTLVEDSAWVISQGTTEIHTPATPLCWQGQIPGDGLQWHDPAAGVDRSTRFRATLNMVGPWGVMNDLLVFEDRIVDHITYRIHRKEDLVREVARYVVLDGLYVRWPMAQVKQ